MKEHNKHWTIVEMARVFVVSRSGYYKFMAHGFSRRTKENSGLVEAIQVVYEKSRRTYGSPRVWITLIKQGYACSRQRVARLMNRIGLRAKMNKSFKQTTRVDSRQKAWPNLLDQNFTASKPNEKWVADISYIRTMEGWLYLAVVLDLYSRKIVGLAMDKNLQTNLVTTALKQALKRREPSGELQHHSDRGCQYTSKDFQVLLNEHGISCSMSAAGYCYDNAVAESFFHTLKTECVYCEHYTTREEAKASIFEYIELFYNNQRIHSTLGYLSPSEFEQRHSQ